MAIALKIKPMTQTPILLEAARAHWNWRGQTRPPFAVAPRPGQVSVWDFPRPPRLAHDAREVVIAWNGVEVARTRHAVLVLETAHPPSFYIPWADVNRELLQPGKGSSFCEWKGPASYWSVVKDLQTLPGVAWSYAKPLPGAEAIANCVAFYPANLDCTVGGERVIPQPGGFYGGWITPELVGPFKGDAGTQGW